MEETINIKTEPMDCPKVENEIGDSFTILAGSKSGILKGIKPNKEGILIKNFPRSSEFTRDDEITTLAWRDEEKSEVLIGHANKSVSLFDCTTGSYIFRVPLTFGKGKVVGIVQRQGNIFVGTESGHIGPLFKLEKSEDKKNAPPPLISTIKYKRSTLLKTKPTLSSVKEDPVNASKIATGGCENDLKIWDVNASSRKLVFFAKNVPPDMLDLRVPVWVSDLTYMPDNRTIAVVSRHKCVRLYDPRAKRKPVLNTNYEESAITCVTSIPNKDKFIAFGTAHGRVTLYDLRSNIHNRAPVVYKQINGAIKDVACCVEDPSKVYSVSLDRYLRIHDLNTKQTVCKEYLKSKLTSVLV